MRRVKEETARPVNFDESFARDARFLKDHSPALPLFRQRCQVTFTLIQSILFFVLRLKTSDNPNHTRQHENDAKSRDEYFRFRRIIRCNMYLNEFPGEIQARDNLVCLNPSFDDRIHNYPSTDE